MIQGWTKFHERKRGHLFSQICAKHHRPKPQADASVKHSRRCHIVALSLSLSLSLFFFSLFLHLFVCLFVFFFLSFILIFFSRGTIPSSAAVLDSCSCFIVSFNLPNKSHNNVDGFFFFFFFFFLLYRLTYLINLTIM